MKQKSALKRESQRMFS